MRTCTSQQELRELLDADSGAEGIVAGVVEGDPSDDSCSDIDSEGGAGVSFDFSTGTNSARGKYDDEKILRRQLYTGAGATLLETALNLCEWKLKHHIKTAAFERLSKQLKKHMLPKDGSKLTEKCHHVEQCPNVPNTKK
eukprot:jgi/Tetstr1/436890/TSEL_025666.t1